MADPFSGGCNSLICILGLLAPIAAWCLLVIGGIAYSLKASSDSSRIRNEVLKAFAAETGLAMAEGQGEFNTPILTGDYNGRDIWIGYTSQRFGDSRYIFLTVQVPTKSAPDFSFGLIERKIITWSTLLGDASEVKLGTQEFDDEYRLTANNALRVKRVFSKEMQQKIREVFKDADLYRILCSDCKLKADKLSPSAAVLGQPMITSAPAIQQIRIAVETMCALADMIDKY